MATPGLSTPDNLYSFDNAGSSSRALITELISGIDSHEKGIMRAGFIQSFGGADHNPSPISQKTFKEMSFDPQIRAGQQILTFAVLSKGYSFRYPGEDKKFGQEMITYLTKAFQMVNRNINQNGGAWFVMRDMLENGSSYGYSVSETVLGEIGEIEPNKVFPIKLKVLPNETLEDCFRISDFGDLEAVIQNRARQGEVTFEDEEDLERLLVYSHLKKSGNWYGTSDLISAFDNWFAKSYIRKFYWIYLERFAAPFLVGTVQNPNHMNDMNTALDSSRTKTCFTVIAGDEVNMLESSHNEGFLEALKYIDSQIMLSLLVPTLLLGIEATGARSLGDVHFSTFLWHVRARQREFSDTWQTLINFLINLNFPSEKVDGVYPELIFPVVATRDMGYMADAIYKLVTGGVISPDEDWIRMVLEVPDDGELNATGGVVETDKTPKQGTQPIQPEQPKQPKQPVETPPERKLRASDLKFKENIKQLKSILSRRERGVKEIIKEFLGKQKDEVIGGINPIRDGKKPKKTRVDKTPYERRLRAQLTGTSDEILDYNKEIFDNMDLTLNFGFSRQALNELIEDLTETTFTGTVDKVAYAAKDAILPGIKAGASNADLAKLVEQVYTEYNQNQLDTVATTLVNDMQNAARLDLYKANPDFVPGVMYDAVMDERTTIFCETHDGLFIRLDNPDIEYLRPPNHFRSFDPTTLVLTDDGWIKFDDANDNTKFASLNPETNEMEFVDYIRKIKHKHTGHLVWINHPDVDLKVTPDHRMTIMVDGKAKSKFASLLSPGDVLFDKDNKLYTLSKDNIDTIEYNDDVICVELGLNHILYVKGDKNPVWCGNCRSLYSPVTILDGKFKETYNLDAVVENAELLEVPTDKLGRAVFPDKKFGRTFFEDKYGGSL